MNTYTEMDTLDDLEDYFWKKPTSIRNYYSMKILGYVNLVCAAITVTSNIFMTLVLTRKNMISPINRILTHYIRAITLVALGYIPRTYHEFFRIELCSIPEHNTYIWETISYYSYGVGFYYRHTAVWMAMMIAVWRYIAIIHPLKERRYCDTRTTIKFIKYGYTFVGVITVLPFMGIGVGPAVKLLDENGCPATNYTIGKNVTIYEFQIPYEKYRLVYEYGLYAYSIFLKLIPSLVLAVVSIKLISNLWEAKKRREEMVVISKRKNTYNSRMQQKMRKQTERTTKILLVILTLFVVGEVPHGVCGFLAAWYGPKFFWKYYYYAMEVFNTFTQIAECFNFFVYYSMSCQFRSTFKSLFSGNSNTSKTITPKTVTPQRSNSSFPVIEKPRDDSTQSSSIVTISSNCT